MVKMLRLGSGLSVWVRVRCYGLVWLLVLCVKLRCEGVGGLGVWVKWFRA